MNGHSLSGRTAVTVVLGAVLMMPIGVASAKKLSQPGKVMDEHLAKCAEKYAYDPNEAEGLGEYDLAPQEMEWRRCAYQGVREIMIPNTRIPDAYRQLIDEDRAMTEKIQRREMTRSERRARLDQILESVRAHEKELNLRNLEKQQTELKARMDEIERMRRIESMMRR
jgi:hypothetical protein